MITPDKLIDGKITEEFWKKKFILGFERVRFWNDETIDCICLNVSRSLSVALISGIVIDLFLH